MEQTNEKKIKKPRASSSKSAIPAKTKANTVSKKINSTSTVTTKKVHPVEYYDLPYRYNETKIQILAQTPHSIFIYWDISDADREKMKKEYGTNFFNETKPVLLVHNQTQNYSFEIEIDDFTNSWYLRTPTSSCKFNIELGRKRISEGTAINFASSDNILHISSSNMVESPNDHILKDTLKGPLLFENVKTKSIEKRNILNLPNVAELYKEFKFNDEFIHNPSSDFRI